MGAAAMKLRMFWSLTLSLLLGGAASAECVYPKAPTKTPDGLTATQDEMVSGMQAVKDYNARVTEYLACLEKEMNERVEAAGPNASPEQIGQIKAIHNKRHNAAVEALEAHATQFNEQVKAFKARENKS
jgi:hypothetical protein